MKFKNFVKSLASSGVIYKRGIEDLPFADRWLASPTAMMLIPTTVKSVTAAAIQDMPQAIDKMIDQIGHTDYAVLSEAIMPYARKNHDYGDSFHQTFVEEGMAMARIRLGDKFNRFKTLSRNEEQKVNDESIRDTLIDLANYAIMTVLEIEVANHDGK